MKIKILFDQCTRNETLSTGWGFSCLVNDQLLFDTGGDGRVLLKNLNALGVKLPKIRNIVISHSHRDHQGGLGSLLKKPVRACVWMGVQGTTRGIQKKALKAGSQIVLPKPFSKIASGVFTTGEIPAIYRSRHMPEQSLVIKTRRGLTVVTGCAHPGIVMILETVKAAFRMPVYRVIGGFHLRRKHRTTITSIINRFKEIGIREVAPCHCTGKTAFSMLRSAYGSRCFQLQVGDQLVI